jgi:hypothetical protein
VVPSHRARFGVGEHSIPRATADRLVARHQRSLNPDANRLNEATSEPAEEGVQKVFSSLWPRLRRVLVNPGSIYQFVLALASACKDSCFEVRDNGILKSQDFGIGPQAEKVSHTGEVKLSPKSKRPSKGGPLCCKMIAMHLKELGNWGGSPVR